MAGVELIILIQFSDNNHLRSSGQEIVWNITPVKPQLVLFMLHLCMCRLNKQDIMSDFRAAGGWVLFFTSGQSQVNCSLTFSSLYAEPS